MSKPCSCQFYLGYEPECLRCDGTPHFQTWYNPRWYWQWSRFWRDLGRAVLPDALAQVGMARAWYMHGTWPEEKEWPQILRYAERLRAAGKI